jgi:hypothetical protein
MKGTTLRIHLDRQIRSNINMIVLKVQTPANYTLITIYKNIMSWRVGIKSPVVVEFQCNYILISEL